MLNTNLEIASKTIEDLYDMYSNKLLIVNRRYQRKLVWSLDEKKALISSIIEEYPIPLLLFVKIKDGREILDGMQRLEAVMGFVEQKFDFDGEYFDLDSTALTKDLKDRGVLKQNTPILSRSLSATFLRYKFAVSEYSSDDSSIDEVFRRINSNGKRLTKQELRSAGNWSNFAELVRKISTIIRGDTSHSDILKLNSMSEISIGTDNLNYGICINDHFYVKNSVLTRNCIRGSDDEELVANILAYIALTKKPTSGSTSLDDFYGVNSANVSQRENLDNFIQVTGSDKILNNFIYIYEVIKELFKDNNANFKKHILGDNSSSKKSPRYYQAVFLAIYELIINENLVISNEKGLFNKLKNSGAKVIQVTDGGRWTAIAREQSVEDLKAILRRFCKLNQAKIQNHAWITEIDRIITSSKTEQTNYDFKQGFMRLDGTHDFDYDLLHKVIATCVGINNIGNDSRGFVLIGIADSQSCADRLLQMYSVDSIESNGFFIAGIDHEANEIFGSIDKYYQHIKSKISNLEFTEKLKQQLLKDIKICDYNGRHLIKIEIKSVGEVCTLDDNFYLRQGTSTDKKNEPREMIALIGNYNSGR
ncbi:DUF262 domain-containing protein [Aliivibrio logei]|uniref:GmrSD restriction endonucleases N-terminal domain-containing protein n=1 Tax=Aliivibrio logei TaxID=688 RepID=A0A1B9NUC4_ALILO|nr:DUF262 domain-containing protein [Aliivibrio logei]OCH17623.1 hypothetical protein A6E04_18555 [Aliivibrio logei]